MKLACGKAKGALAVMLLFNMLLASACPVWAQPNQNSNQPPPSAIYTTPIPPLRPAIGGPASGPFAPNGNIAAPPPLRPAIQNATNPPAPSPSSVLDTTPTPTGAVIPSPATVDIDQLDATHDKNSTLSMGDLRLHSALHASQFKPIRLEVAYDELINLEEALNYAMENNLAVKISHDNLNYQRYVLYGQVANALPNLTMAYNLTHTDIINEKVLSLAKVFLTRVTYPVFQGGSVAYGIMGQIYREKGWREAYKASIADELLDLYQKYNNVLVNRILLQIRAKAVEVSQEQLRINVAAEKSGTGTRFAVLQADAQLSSDKQALLQQQVLVRQAALALNFSMNYPMAVNLVPVEETISEQSIFQEDASIDALINLALKNRPELREYEDFKVAAGRNIQVAAAPLYPQASFYTQYSYTNTMSTPPRDEASGTAGAGVFGGLFQTYQEGFALVYSLNSFGLTSVANLFAANSLARQAGIQANQELQTIIQQVRSDYLNWRAAREQIDNAAHSVRASQEELRLAQLRMGVEVTTELEVIQAQRDYINSLTSQAQAIVNSNLAQAQLLHDCGLITQDRLLHGFKGKIK
jgi:OMF family outer membrane factor